MCYGDNSEPIRPWRHATLQAIRTCAVDFTHFSLLGECAHCQLIYIKLCTFLTVVSTAYCELPDSVPLWLIMISVWPWPYTSPNQFRQLARWAALWCGYRHNALCITALIWATTICWIRAVNLGSTNPKGVLGISPSNTTPIKAYYHTNN
jgi:hypothetical protein